MTLNGIDVSSNNGTTINWTKVKASGIGFVWIKLSEGSNYRNPLATAWTQQAQAADLLVGFYHFCLPAEGGAEAELDWLQRQLTDVWQPGMPVASDFEEDPYGQPTLGDYGTWALPLMSGLRDHLGFPPMLYSRTDFIANHGLSRPEYADCGLWLASYGAEPAVPAPWQFYACWQTSDRGSVDGINGGVDLDEFEGDAAAWRAYGTPVEAPQPAPAPPPADYRALWEQDEAELIRLRNKILAAQAALS